MLNADQIKVRLIDFLIERGDNNLIASEVSFYHGYRKADLIQLTANTVTAFEIKSDRDTLSKLPTQLDDYTNTFSFCYLVTTERHLKNARNIASSKVGIILIKDNTIKILRKPTEGKRLSKHSLTLGLSGENIQKLTKNICRTSTICEKRKHIEQRVSLQHLKQSFYEELIEKYQNKYQNFLLDRGLKTTLTDLYYLQSSY